MSSRIGLPIEHIGFVYNNVELYRDYYTLREFWVDIVQEEVNKKFAESQDQELDTKVVIEIVQT
jgi:hypothetical protein